MNITGSNNTNQWGTLSKVANSNKVDENNKNAKSLMLNQNNKTSSYAALERTKEDLIKSREALGDEEMNPDLKKDKIKEINKQIAEIEAQIQQAKTLEKEKEQEKIKKKMEENQSKNIKPGDELKGGVIISESLKNLIESKQSMDNVTNLKATKTALTVEKGWLTPNDNPDSFVSRQYAKLSKGINGLEQRIASESAKIYENATNTKVDSNDNAKENENVESKDNAELKDNTEEKDSSKE